MFWVITLLVFLIVLFQTPILIDLLKVFFPEWRLKRFTSQAASTLLVVLMNTFFLTGLGMHVFLFVPLVTDIRLTPFKLICHCVFAYWVWINMVINYWYAVLVDPGRSSTELSEHQVDQSKSDGSEALLLDHGMKWHIKTLHYCKTCDAMTLYMDHHCPFTNSCIGLHNYSYFFLGLVYATIGQCYSIIIGFLFFGECLLPGIWRYLDWAYLQDSIAVCTTFEPYADLVLPVVGGFMVQTVLLLFHVFLLFGNITTYDVIKNVWTIPVFKFGWQRFRAGKHRESESRLNVLLLKRRPNLLWFLVPVRNSDLHQK